jgi:hypothetical protein
MIARDKHSSLFCRRSESFKSSTLERLSYFKPRPCLEENEWSNLRRCFAVLSTWHSINLPFCQLAISSTCNFINLLFQQLAILSTCHFVNLPFCLFAILSTCDFAYLPFCQITISSNCYFVNLPFCQLAILSTCNFVNLPFCQLAILSTCHFIKLLFCKLAILLIKGQVDETASWETRKLMKWHNMTKCLVDKRARWQIVKLTKWFSTAKKADIDNKLVPQLEKIALNAKLQTYYKEAPWLLLDTTK